MPVFSLSPRRLGLSCGRLHQRLDEEVISPGHRLIYPQALVLVIDPVEQDSFPARPAAGEEFVRAESLQDGEGSVTIAVLLGRFRHRFREIPETTRRNRSCRTVPQRRPGY